MARSSKVSQIVGAPRTFESSHPSARKRAKASHPGGYTGLMGSNRVEPTCQTVAQGHACWMVQPFRPHRIRTVFSGRTGYVLEYPLTKRFRNWANLRNCPEDQSLRDRGD